jgi:ABC-type Fe3+-hydroxamate transport system substrate-binding protein
VTPPRVVSLVPSVTETLLALGVTPVACTRFCEQPSLRAVGGTKDPDVAAVVALMPDVVVMNDEENRRDDYDALRAAGCAVVDVSPRSVRDVGPTVARLAEVVGVAVPAPFSAWDEWLDRSIARASPRRSVTMVWRRPWMALGVETYGASVLDRLGLTTPFTADRYPEVTLDRVRALAPDVVVLPSEPYPFAERHAREVGDALPGVAVHLVDGRDLFWWGVRTPAALSRLASQLH